MKEKTARIICTPLCIGKPVRMILQDGTEIQTYPTKILKAVVSLQDKCFYIDFTTKNSVYRNVAYCIEPTKDYIDGQILMPGYYVSVGEAAGEQVIIDSIDEISNKIVIKDTSNDIYSSNLAFQEA